MIRIAVTLLALSAIALPSPSEARGGPRTLSDYNIQKESALLPAPHRRHFNGLTTRAIGARAPQGARWFPPGATPYSTIRLNRGCGR